MQFCPARRCWTSWRCGTWPTRCTPVGQLEAFLNQDEFAKTEEGFKQFREGLAQASDAAMTTFEGFQTVELARLQTLLAGIDPAEEGAAAAVAAVQAEIDGLFDRWLVGPVRPRPPRRSSPRSTA